MATLFFLQMCNINTHAHTHRQTERHTTHTLSQRLCWSTVDAIPIYVVSCNVVNGDVRTNVVYNVVYGLLFTSISCTYLVSSLACSCWMK